MQKDSKTALGFVGVLVGLILISIAIRTGGQNTSSANTPASVSIENGVQIIDLSAKGGFTPSYIEAKAGIPTELRVATNGTYDCSSSLLIPSLGYRKNLKPTGTETISITEAQAQGTLNGTCGMGMYKFKIAFK
jgi:Cu+-exporting ATPase